MKIWGLATEKRSASQGHKSEVSRVPFFEGRYLSRPSSTSTFLLVDPDELSLLPLAGHLNIRQNNLNSRLVFEVLSKRNLTVWLFKLCLSQFQMKLLFCHISPR